MIQQGHRYSIPSISSIDSFLALSSGEGDEPVRVAELDDSMFGLGTPFHMYARQLVPEPMRYFHGETK